jgi:hypothetical protein
MPRASVFFRPVAVFHDAQWPFASQKICCAAQMRALQDRKSHFELRNIVHIRLILNDKKYRIFSFRGVFRSASFA